MAGDSILGMDSTQHSGQKTARKYSWWTILLLALPYIGLCFPSLYARATPALFGFPFFYWYQFAWVVATSILLYVVYRALKTHE